MVQISEWEVKIFGLFLHDNISNAEGVIKKDTYFFFNAYKIYYKYVVIWNAAPQDSYCELEILCF